MELWYYVGATMTFGGSALLAGPYVDLQTAAAAIPATLQMARQVAPWWTSCDIGTASSPVRHATRFGVVL